MTRTRSLLLAGGLAAAILLAVLPLTACTTRVVTGGSDRDTVTVSGTGTALSKPDRADITFGVTAQAVDPKAAMNQAAVTSDKVVKALKAAGVTDDNLQTTGVTLQAQYDYSGGKAPRITGYQATVQVRARVTDLAKIGDVITAGTNAGATSVNGPNFSLSDTNPTKFKALDLAVADAKAKAASLAQAAGRPLGPVVSITEGTAQASYQPDYASALLRVPMRSAAVPIQPGTLEDRANVTVVFALQ